MPGSGGLSSPGAAAPSTAAAGFGFGTPWAEQIDFLRRKLDLPTEWWDDITGAAHDRAFIVAGAAKADLLQDLHTAVVDAASGGALAGFRKDFKAVVAKHGWTGWTGEGSAAGEAWRTRIIYQTNMATSYAAGRYKQLTEPGFAALRPYWRYVHADGQLHPRPLHLAWNGLTLPLEHPFWKTHFAPNGWGCRCEIVAVAAPAPSAATEPPAGWDKVDPATGTPPGIDPGFAYAPGANATTPLQALIDQKLIKLDAPIGAQMWQALKPALAMERQQAWWQTLDTWLASPLPQGRQAVVGTLAPQTLDQLGVAGIAEPDNAVIAVSDRLVLGATARHNGGAGNALLAADWRQLPELLDAPGAAYLDTASGNLVFVADSSGTTHAVVRYDPASSQVVAAYRASVQDVAAALKVGQWRALAG